MPQVVDIQDYKSRYAGELRRTTSAPISERNRELILSYNKHCFLKGITAARRIKLLESLTRIASQINVDYDKATKQDLMDYIEKLEQSDYAEWSKATFKTILKQFYKWLKGNDEEYPPEVKWINASIKKRSQKLPDELLTKEEAVKLLNACWHIRDKAFISALFESGCRVSEIGNMLLKHVVFDQYGCVIVVNGKTGMRRVRLIDSTPYLANWVENHPHRENLENPLWVSLTKRFQPVIYQTIRKMLIVTAERAGIRKRVNPHSFRHSRATINANFLTEAQMNHYFGWTQGSRMPSVYVHMSGRDLDATIINMHHPEQKVMMNTAVENNFDPKKCPRCFQQNPSTSKFCNRCGGALELQEVLS